MQSQPNQNDSPFGEIIYAYTRANALADGELVDVTEHARQIGFRLPVALTRSLWAEIESIPERYSYEDINGRIHDVLWMAYLVARHARRGESRMGFSVILHTSAVAPDRREHTKSYIMDMGPGDEGEPVITFGKACDF